MEGRNGLFIVFEGADGSGKSVQARKLLEHIQELSKYQDILMTHEPWKNSEIKRRLKDDKELYKDGKEMAWLFVEDRIFHTRELIKLALSLGTIVLCDRYKMSTCAYQWAQGIELQELIMMHKNKNMLTPDLTYLLNVDREVAEERRGKRGAFLEKYERETIFTEKVIQSYRRLGEIAQNDEAIFGKVIMINGNREVEEVEKQVIVTFDALYQELITRKKV